MDKQKIENLKAIIQKIYLEDDIPWVVGYSGGKDSTATLQLVWLALAELGEEKLHKDIHVICTDTLVESPVVANWVIASLENMERAAKEQRLRIKTHRLTPEIEDTYWVNLIGRGYPYPRINFRWCTERLKIRPSNKFVQEMVSKHGEVIMVLGTRKAESNNRMRTMTKYEQLRVRDFLSPNSTILNELIFSPLEDWSNDDVWMFLMQYPNPWGYSNKDLLSMYRGATADGECPLVRNTNTPSCGKSRFGCWVCTLVEKDKSMEAMIQNDEEKVWMTPLLDFRNEIGNPELDRSRRDFRRMKGNLHLYKGRLVHGPYKKEVRQEWLRRLLSIQLEINRTGPKEFKNFKLITDEELSVIRRIWVVEKHEFEDALPDIYKEVTGNEFIDTMKPNSSIFHTKEWDLLQQVCKEKYPEEELLPQLQAALIDIESTSSNMRYRGGILKNIELEIRKSFYKNEEDAEKFALAKLHRKQEFGGNYDSEADIPEEEDIPEEVEDEELC